MTDTELAYQQIRIARWLIESFCVTDPTLWPVLSEIDMALMRGLPAEHRVRRLPDRRQARTGSSTNPEEEK